VLIYFEENMTSAVTKEVLAEKKRIAKEYVAKIRAVTYCSRCGAQPVDWHSDAHVLRPHFRVGNLTAQGNTPKRIQEEMDRCTPLCRSCHMATDGRAAALTASRPRKKGDVLVDKKPCENCGKPEKPLRKGLCNRCNHQKRYHGDPEKYAKQARDWRSTQKNPKGQ
jgi:deoxycytidylate deaminase